MQNRHGGWPSLAKGIGDQQNGTGDPDATVQIGFLMGEIYGEKDPAYLKGKELFESYLDECAQDIERGYRVRLRDGEREELDVYHLTHLLLSWLLDPPRRFQSGYDASDPRLKRMMEALIDIQREDGGWRPSWGYWENPPNVSYEDFVQGYAETASVLLTVSPPTRFEGAAGSVYASVPVLLVATHFDGSQHAFVGCYVARRANLDIDPDGEWSLYSATVTATPANVTDATLLADACVTQ